MNVLVIAAHPDDEVLGCGGTIARLAREGHEVYIALLGEGVTSRYADRAEADMLLVAELRNQAKTVADILGAKDVFLDDLPDNRFDTVPLLDVVKRVEALVERVRPEVVYTHDGGDLNVDHRVVFQATLTATRPTLGTTVREVLAFEAPSSTEWAFGHVGTPFHPNVFVDIADALDTKLRALSVYEGEARVYPHPRSPEAICALAQYRGSSAGLCAAEAFELVHALR